MHAPASQKALTVVVIDDDPAHRELVEQAVHQAAATQYPVEVRPYCDADEALVDLPPSGKVLILCDNMLGAASGLDWLPDFVRAGVGPVILMTSQGDEQIAAEAFHRGASDYVDKQTIFNQPDHFWNTAREAMRRYKLERSNRELARNLKLANRQLKERNRLLQQMTEQAHQFVDDVAHEFRTPLTVIREFGSILTDNIGGELTDDQRIYVGHIDTAARDLSQMVDDFLDSSKLKTHTLRVDRQNTTLDAIFEHTRAALQARARAKSIGLDYQLEPDLPGVFCDAEKAGRVLINLVVNAIKFSKANGRVQIAAEATGNGEVRVSVTDHGVGIGEEQMATLCERFEQGEQATYASAKGFGLGLNIAQSLTWLNLGQMSIDSTPGKGSTFSFTLPVQDPEHLMGRYARQIREAQVHEDLAIVRIQPVHPDCDAEQARQVLCNACRSLDLLLPAADGRTIIAVGPYDAPDQWLGRMKEIWQRGAPEPFAKSSLVLEWQGNYPLSAVADHVVRLLMRPGTFDTKVA
jgi:hypothetical protein